MSNSSNHLERLGRDLWSEGGLRRSLSAGAVVVLDWPIDQRVSAADTLLSDEERSRVERFRFDKDKTAFVMTRAGLRAVLAGWLEGDARGVRFSCGPHGKPGLADSRGQPALRFNVSHSGGLAVVALAIGQEVGVDVERLPAGRAAPLLVARRCFVGNELTALEDAEGETKNRVFYRLWTRKEAIIKLTGQGLSADLKSFQTPVEPRHAGWAPRPTGGAEGRDRCWLESVTVRPGYTAAVAVEDRPREIVRLGLSFG